MKIKVLLTKEHEFEVGEKDLYNLIIRNIEANGRDQHDPKVVNDYLYLIPDMLRVAISDRFNKYHKDNYDIFSLKDQIETVNEAQERVLSIHREKMEEYNERMRKREETNKAHQHYNDLLKKLPKSQQTAFGPLFIESVDERGLNMRHENGELYGIKEDRENDASALYLKLGPGYVNKDESARWGGCLLFGERHLRLGRVQRLAEEHFEKYIRKNETITDRQNRPVVR